MPPQPPNEEKTRENSGNIVQGGRSSAGGAGVYVHFPWCLAKCPYCDFVSFASEKTDIDHVGYANAILRELAARAPLLDDRPIQTIFFGGGTPSLWAAEELGRTLAGIRKTLACTTDVEITVECNPTSLDHNKAQALVDQGVNRFSIGVQGLDEARLKFLGRKHDPAGAIRAVKEALEVARTAGEKNVRVSADLIFAVAEETPETGKNEAITLSELGLTHLSCYELTIEPGTQFGELAKRGRLAARRRWPHHRSVPRHRRRAHLARFSPLRNLQLRRSPATRRATTWVTGTATPISGSAAARTAPSATEKAASGIAMSSTRKNTWKIHAM